MMSAMHRVSCVPGDGSRRDVDAGDDDDDDGGGDDDGDDDDVMTMTIKRKHNLTRTDDECPAAEARVIHQPRGDEGCRDLRRRAQAEVEVAVIGHQS